MVQDMVVSKMRRFFPAPWFFLQAGPEKNSRLYVAALPDQPVDIKKEYDNLPWQKSMF
jgi:hypothetical protein